MTASAETLDSLVQGSEALITRLLDRITKNETGCWEWNRKCKPNGYGNCGSGFPHQHAHKTAYILFKGAVPNGLWVLHTCDNKKCCNPDHLYLGTVQDNVKDAIERGFWPKGKNKKKGNLGENNCKAKLSEKDVLFIRESKQTARCLSKRYDVHESTIYNIRSKRTWNHI